MRKRGPEDPPGLPERMAALLLVGAGTVWMAMAISAAQHEPPRQHAAVAALAGEACPGCPGPEPGAPPPPLR